MRKEYWLIQPRYLLYTDMGNADGVCSEQKGGFRYHYEDLSFIIFQKVVSA